MWDMDNKTPKKAINVANTYCYGFLHKDDGSSCKLCYAKIPTVGSAAVGS